MPSHSDPDVLLSFILLLIIASATAYYASKKGRNPLLWFIIGVLLGVFAPLILLFLSWMQSDQKNGESPGMTVSNPDPSLQNLPQIPLEVDPAANEIENKLWYYLDQHHEQMGPVSVIALRDLWNHGQLELNSYVWSDGMDQWQKVDNLPQMKEVLNKK